MGFKFFFYVCDKHCHKHISPRSSRLPHPPSLAFSPPAPPVLLRNRLTLISSSLALLHFLLRHDRHLTSAKILAHFRRTASAPSTGRSAHGQHLHQDGDAQSHYPRRFAEQELAIREKSPVMNMNDLLKAHCEKSKSSFAIFWERYMSLCTVHSPFCAGMTHALNPPRATCV
jgi:hypothetical protein